MRSRRMTLVFLALIMVAACGADTADGPVELAEKILQATEDGDNARWRELMDDDAVTVFPDGSEIGVFGRSPFIDDDFDGDGVLAWADDVQFRNAMHGPAQQSMEWECEEVASDRATCRVSTMDGFIRYDNGPPMEMEMSYTLADGKCVKEEGAIADEATFWQSAAAWDVGLAAYQRWVNDTHREAHDELFNGPCCEARLRTSEGAVDLHHDLLSEFFAAAE